MNIIDIVRKHQYLYIILGIALILMLPYLYYTTYSITKPIKEMPLSEIKEIRRTIEVRIKDDIIFFKMTIYYNASAFNVIIDNWSQYTHSIVNDVSRFMEKPVNAKNLDIKFQNITFSVIVTFKVYNAISRYGNECSASFTWLLNPLNLNLIYNDFKGYNNRIVWYGEVNGYTMKSR